ncbi:hypothetical protein [uncultured Haemophilus sp.]|jgi:hypothetical protein|uniref:hypothetical protein n=1 Tax=uncultured Haemophilus sp. TaxID=237779 RepID=UPI0025F940E5|nr:hypothetical protein [uncultured Haemophilus sp.]
MSLSPELEYLMRSLSCVTYNGAQHSDIQINESDSLAKLKVVNIKAGNGDWFCFSPDEGRKCKKIHSKSNMVIMSPLLTIGEGFDHHCACDAVIFIKKDNGIVIIYIDLKSDNPTGYSPQFKSARQFIRYLIGLHEEFQKSKLSIIEERYIVLHSGKRSFLNKSTTIKKDKIGKTYPDKAFKREVKNGDTLYLKELLS